MDLEQTHVLLVPVLQLSLIAQLQQVLILALVNLNYTVKLVQHQHLQQILEI